MLLGWHVGALGNGKTVGFEICEPKNIAYANANHTKVDTVRYDPKNPEVKADFEKRYKNGGGAGGIYEPSDRDSG